MFSNEDVQEILNIFPPPTNHFESLPSLVHASSSQGLITLSHLQNEFEKLVTTETTRIAVPDLSYKLDAENKIVAQLVHSQPDLALLSDTGNEVVPKVERDAIRQRVHEALSNGIVSKTEFATQSKIDSKSFDSLLDDQEDKLVPYGDHVCTEKYEKVLSDYLSLEIDAIRSNQSIMNLSVHDVSQLPGSPPKWLVIQHLNRIVESKNVADEVFVLSTPTTIRVQSKHLRANNVQAWAMRLLSGELAYIDLEVLFGNWRSIYDSINGVLSDLRNVEGVEVVETFAISERWISELVDQKLKSLHYSETGVTDVAQDLGEKIQHGKLWALAPGDGHRKFPESLYGHVERKLERYIDAALGQKPYTVHHRFETIVITGEQYVKERDALVESAKDSAAAQWRQLRENHEHGLKFSTTVMTDASATNKSIREALMKERPTQKACEEQFWASIAELEAQNETDFATFWTDRVNSRVHVYNEGLGSIKDQKLRDQLSELFAYYVQKELVVEAISKARSQSLVLSRKTRKNIQKLETTLPALKTDAFAIVSTIDNFTKKQGIDTTTSTSLEDFKKSMIQDMLRRMQKLQKPSDAPVLFLTLVVILFAKHYAGAIYATGKYAPKLLKQLKSELPQEQYEQVEKWKEDAKSGILSAEDREEMRKMAVA